MTVLAESDVLPQHGHDAAEEAARPVRVLFINDTARNGGPGRSLHSILQFLDPAVVHRAVVLPRAGVIADLLARDRVAEELHFEPNLVENPIEPWSRAMERSDFDAPLVRKGVRLAGNIVKATMAIARLAALARRGRFDLLYCNGTNADFAGASLARITGIPALWHVRYTSLPPAVRGLHRTLSASSGVRRIICVSKAATPLFAHCASKVRVIHNALDVSAFDPQAVRGTLRAELNLRGDAVVFGSHGRVLRRKGYVEMIRAARIALDRLPPDVASRVHFVVVGDTPDDYRPDHVEECAALAQSLGLSERFRMLGFRADVRPLVADFDVAVVPSVYPDPLPRSVIESMALGKPVIAYAVGGVVEMIESEAAAATGQLVPFEPSETGEAPERSVAASEGASAGAIDQLASAIVAYALDPDRRAREGEHARRCVLRDFDARAHARRVQSEILEACADSGAGRRGVRGGPFARKG
jgi:glycosyltransferase involved in cell wall biosynthesis